MIMKNSDKKRPCGRFLWNNITFVVKIIQTDHINQFGL